MKQFVPEKIVNKELTDVQRSKLKHGLDNISGWDGSFIKEPGLSIGEMIEFLELYKVHEAISLKDKWMLKPKDQICDALWEACKEVLS